MGIPAQKHLKPTEIPAGYEQKITGPVGLYDKVWSTSEGKFIEANEFPKILGDPTEEFWFIIQPIEEENA